MYKIYHNPKCSTSRFVLDALRESGIEPEIVLYLKTPPTKDELRDIVKKAGLHAREIVRKRQKEAVGYDFDAMNDEEILSLLAREPMLIERPIVVHDDKALLARPKTLIFDFINA